jgi:hypothetical protein
VLALPLSRLGEQPPGRPSLCLAILVAATHRWPRVSQITADRLAGTQAFQTSGEPIIPVSR